jgi:hypothetical protein
MAPDSKRMEARVWIGRYRECFGRWASSAYADTDALAEAVKALRSLLERCPDLAADVERIAAVACFASRRGNVPQAIANLAQCGLEADMLVPPEQQSIDAPAILLLSLAEAELHAQRRLPGLDALLRLERRLELAPADDVFARWVRSRMHLLLADLHELGREEEQARAAYSTALTHVTPLLDDATSREAFLRAWAAAMSEQPTTASTQSRPAMLDEIALMELRTLASSSALGAARSVTAAGSMLERAAAARTAMAIVKLHGTPPDLSPFELTAVLASLPPDEAEAFGAALIAHVERQRAQYEAGEIPADITDLQTIAILRGAMQRQAELLKREQIAFDVMAHVAVSEAHRLAGDAARAEHAALDAVRRAIESRLGGAQIFAIGQAFATVAERDREAAAPMRDAFLAALSATVQSDPGFLAAQRLRAQLDRPLAMAITGLLESLGPGHDAPTRRQVAALLDLLRRAETPPPGLFLAQRDEPASPRHLAADSIGRIRAALRERDDTVAIVSHVSGSQVAFLLIRSDADPLEHCVAGPEYMTASAALERAAYVALRAGAAKRKAAETALADAGRRAFAALPAELAHAIRDHEVILFAPDFRGRQDTIPFELMKDGKGCLGVRKVFARSPSLAHLATSIDTRLPSASRRRALVAAVPVAEGYDALDLAPREQQEIVEALTAQGFDAPTIDPARLSATFFTDRLPYVDVLHVSSHGEVGADLEWLVLPRGQRLVVDDLLETPQYRLPFVYLNTCNLGQTRYLGAGVSRGLAHTFAELGAPAVVAHTKPVSDRAALRLASAFHAAIGNHDVGNALLEARKALHAEGDLASWASAVLIGDPRHSPSAPASQSIDDPGSDLLDAFFGLDVDEATKSDAWQTALAKIEAGECPRVEAALGLVQMVSALRGDDPREDMATLADAVDVADALHHLPSRAMLRLVLAAQADERGPSADAQALLEDTIRYLAPLAAFEPQWGAVLVNVRGKLAKQRSSARGLEIRAHLPPGQEDDGSMDAIMEALMGAQQSAEDTYGRATVRDTETDANDVAWNAVVMGHPNRFEDIPESVRFAAIVARKFVQIGSLPSTSLPYAVPMLAGLLRYLWDSQNLNHLGRDAAEAQAGALLLMLDEIRTHWSPPGDAAPLATVAAVPAMVDELLAFLDGLDWQEIYKHLDERMDALSEKLEAMLAGLQEKHPSALAGCAAYVCGVVMEKNTFSPLDGSVPESIGERLTRVYHALARENPAHFFACLAKSHEALASRPQDELARWKMDPQGVHAAGP